MLLVAVLMTDNSVTALMFLLISLEVSGTALVKSEGGCLYWRQKSRQWLTFLVTMGLDSAGAGESPRSATRVQSAM